MKTIKYLKTGLVLSAIAAIAIAINIWLPAKAGAADEPMKAGQHMQHLQSLTTKKEVDALKTGDTIAMACAKCKTVWVSQVIQNPKGARVLGSNGKPTELVGKHLCAGCKSTIEVVGHAKGNITELRHTCSACGGEVFCCATKPGHATKGMEK
jgi:hypothetical protein